MTEIPHMVAPPNTCDSHIHIYDTTTPLVPWTTTPGPAWATVSAYRDVQKRLGLTRAVVVQANAYGTDNTCAACRNPIRLPDPVGTSTVSESP